MKINKKGFTLIEMLAVIAIIAVLVAIVIPTVGNAAEKAKEAKDAANIRSAIAEISALAVAGETDANKLTKTINLTQNGKFETLGADMNIGGYDIHDFDCSGIEGAKVVTVTYNTTQNQIVVTFQGNPLVPVS